MTLCHLQRRAAAVIFAVGVTGLASSAFAEGDPSTSVSARELAERDFNLGVEHFGDARYEAAARAFLRANAHVPASDSLGNALLAARRSGVHLLVVEVARLVLSGSESDPGLEAQARAALAESGRYLSRVELGCEPAPCTITVDDDAVTPGVRFVNPGTHRMVAKSGEGDRQQERVETLVAGASYEFVFDLQTRAPERAAEPKTPAPKARVAPPTRATPVPASPRPGRTAPPPASSTAKEAPSTAWSDEAVLGVAALAALSLGGATVWSGLDAKAGRDALPQDPSTEDVEAVRARIVRTDVLLTTTLAATVFSAAWAWLGVDYDLGTTRIGATAHAGGFGLDVRGRL